MRVLLVSFSSLPTLQNYMYLTADSFGDMDIEAYTLGISENIIELEQQEKHFYVPKVDTPKPTVQSMGKMKGCMKKMIHVIEQVQPDVLHFVSKHTWNYFLLKKLRKSGFRGKIVHTFHDPIGHKGDRVRAGVVLYNKLMGRNTDTVIVHSKRNVKITMRYIRPRAEVFFAPLGCSKWYPYKKTESSTKKLLIFGRLNHYKGCEYIPQIAEEVDKLDSDIEIVIAGQSSADVNKKMLEKIRACQNVQFEDCFVPEEKVSDYFNDCDVVLITHTSITQSGILLDAYRYAKPIVCFDIPGIRELIPEAVEPVPAFDCTSFAKKAVQLIQDKELQNNLGLEEWKFGEQYFTNKCMTHSFYEIYKRTLYTGRH